MRGDAKQPNNHDRADWGWWLVCVCAYPPAAAPRVVFLVKGRLVVHTSHICVHKQEQPHVAYLLRATQSPLCAKTTKARKGCPNLPQATEPKAAN